VARDRKRAKQRRARRGTAAAGRGPERPPAASAGGAAGASAGRSELGEPPIGGGRVERADLPGALEHAGEVDEFDAALVAGGGGVAAAPDAAAEAELELEAEEAELDPGADALQSDGVPPAGGRPPGDGGDGGPPGDGALERPSGAPLRSGNRVIGFLRASWSELQRVQWPDRRHVIQATAVVLGFVAVAGAYLGAADYAAKEIVEFVIG
jgi:preprotein translocase SecE subunit